MPPALIFAAAEAPCLAIAGCTLADIGGVMGNEVASEAPVCGTRTAHASRWPLASPPPEPAKCSKVAPTGWSRCERP